MVWTPTTWIPCLLSLFLLCCVLVQMLASLTTALFASRSLFLACWVTISADDMFKLFSIFFCPPPFRRKAEGHCFWFSVGRGAWFQIFSRYFVPLTPPSFCPILLKLYRCFKDGLKMCMWCFQSPEIIFYHFLHILNIDIFWVLILQKSIGSRYLVPLTPPTVFGRSFWNFTWAFRMAWRYACGFFRILK